MTRVLITAQMSLKPYLEAGRLNQQELLASSVSTGGSTRKKCCPGEIACLDLGLHGAYVGGPWLEADRATARRRPRRNYPILVLAHGSRRTEGCWGYTGQPQLLSMLSRATWSGGV